VKYDYPLSCHTFTLAATAYENGIRTGAAQRDNFKEYNGLYSSSVKIPNDGSDHVVTLAIGIVGGGNPPLTRMTVSPPSVTSDAGECVINLGSVSNNFVTDDNGEFTVVFSTKGLVSADSAKTCTITWSKSCSGLYYEY